MVALTREQFLKTDSGALARRELQSMHDSSAYDTRAPRDIIGSRKRAFVNRHINYLAKHPYVSPMLYISNLKTMTRKR